MLHITFCTHTAKPADDKRVRICICYFGTLSFFNPSVFWLRLLSFLFSLSIYPFPLPSFSSLTISLPHCPSLWNIHPHTHIKMTVSVLFQVLEVFFFLPWWPHPGKSSTFWLKIVPVIKSIHYLLPLGITLVCKAGSRLIWGKTFVSLIALLGQMCGRGNETLTCHRRNEAWCE